MKLSLIAVLAAAPRLVVGRLRPRSLEPNRSDATLESLLHRVKNPPAQGRGLRRKPKKPNPTVDKSVCDDYRDAHPDADNYIHGLCVAFHAHDCINNPNDANCARIKGIWYEKTGEPLIPGETTTTTTTTTTTPNPMNPTIVLGHKFGPDYMVVNHGEGDIEKIELPALDPEDKLTRDIAVADVNNDGHKDIIVGMLDNSPNQLLINDGSNGFGTAIALPSLVQNGGNTHSIAAADVNGDGWLDIIVGKSGPNELLLNGGSDDNGNWIGFPDDPGHVIELPGGSRSTTAIAVADVNDDGWPDIVVASEYEQYEKNQLLLNNKEGGFIVTVLPGDIALHTLSVAVADLNGDGWPDIVFGNWDSEPILLLLNDGHGNYPDDSDHVVELSGEGEGGVAVVDIDGDGDLDIIIGNNRGDILAVLLLNDGFLGDGTWSGTFTAKPVPAGEPIWGLAGATDTEVIDWNCDGYPDIVLANYNKYDAPSSQVLLNDGDGNFPDVINLHTSGKRARAVAVFQDCL